MNESVHHMSTLSYGIQTCSSMQYNCELLVDKHMPLLVDLDSVQIFEILLF